MSRFDRKVERTKKKYQFTQKEIKEKDKSISTLFKENFNLRWMRFNIQSILGFVLDFLVVTLIIIPVLMAYLDTTMAFVVGHAFFTGLLMVITVYIVNKQKPKLSEFLIRYLFIALLLGASSYLSMAVTSWLS